ncbi:MAG TPA: hypothetical protein VKD89_09285 [Candidatus Udaeobacter sp.]|nr:hypothetical protein [Candidatus Udaeobacter sp.]
MQNHDSAIGLQLHQRLLQANGMADLFLHELFNQRLAPRVQHPPAETAAETTDSRKSNTSDFDGFAIEHGQTSVVENLGDRFRISGFIIVFMVTLSPAQVTPATLLAMRLQTLL